MYCVAYIGVLLACVTCTLAAQADKPATRPSVERLNAEVPDTYVLHKAKGGASLKAPADWAPVPLRGNIQVFLDAAEPKAASINLIVNTVGPRDNLDVVEKGFAEELAKEVEGAQLERMDRVQIGDHTVLRVAYSHKLQDFRVQQLQFFWIHERKSYILTCTCLERDYDNFRPVAERIACSLKLP